MAVKGVQLNLFTGEPDKPRTKQEKEWIKLKRSLEMDTLMKITGLKRRNNKTRDI